MRFEVLETARKKARTQDGKRISKRILSEAAGKVGPGWWEQVQSWGLQPYWRDVVTIADYLKVPIEVVKSDERPVPPNATPPKPAGRVRRFPAQRGNSGAAEKRPPFGPSGRK